MKKKVFCIFFLIFYLLITCTVLSRKIESVMSVQTESYQREMNTYSTSSVTIGKRALFTDAQGEHLYEITTGTGWERGLRIQEIPGNLWSIDSRGVINLQSGRDYNIVYSASRQPKTGDPADIIEYWEEVDDQYLVIYPESVSVAEILQQPTDGEKQLLPENVEIAGLNNNILLLDVKNTKLPFFEHNARAISDTTSVQNCRIFSLTEAAQFLEKIPAVMTIVPVLGMSLLLWGFSCYLSIHAAINKTFIFFNGGIMIALLCVLQYILKDVNFPASMLPNENIFDWQHYRNEYSLIFSALEAFTEKVYCLIAAKEMMLSRCREILCYGLIADGGIVLIECFLLRIKNRGCPKSHKTT